MITGREFPVSLVDRVLKIQRPVNRSTKKSHADRMAESLFWIVWGLFQAQCFDQFLRAGAQATDFGG